MLITGRRKLLLADDSITIQKVVSLTFTDEGLEVITVGNGEQALRQLEESAPDIVLADIFMPGPNGYEICDRIKNDQRFRHIPVMLLVGTFEPFNEAEARRVGADDVLTKPFQSIRELVSKVGSLLGGRTEEEAPKDSRPPAAKADAATREKAAESRAETAAQPGSPVASVPSDVQSSGGDVPPRDRSAAAAAPVASADVFADWGSVDQMIEATPAEEFGGARQEPWGAASTSPPPAPIAEEAPVAVAPAPDARIEESQPFAVSPREEEEQMKSRSSQPASGAETDGAADDALLDLGVIEPASTTAESDDFILDLADETPSAPRPSPSAEAGVQAARADAHRGAREASWEARAETTAPESSFTGFAEGRPSTPSAAPQTFAAPALPKEEAETAMPPTRDTRERAGVASDRRTSAPASDTFGATGGQQISLEQLSPEVIDAIARRAVEQLSEKVVQEIAWEVVPQLAELLIKQRLDQEKTRT